MEAEGILLEVKRFAVHDGPGVRTVLFLKGCPLKCIWCHNPESISSKPQLAYYEHKCIQCGECVPACPHKAHTLTDGKHFFERANCVACGACEEFCLGNTLKLFGHKITIAEAVKLAVEDQDFYGSDGGVTLSGGEPLLQANFCYELLSNMKKNGINTALDTCGCISWKAFEKNLPVTDIFLFDLKHYDSVMHKKFTGQGNELILENLKRLSECGARIEVRIPLVPDCNDSDINIHEFGKLLKRLCIEKVKVLPYHAMAKNKYLAIGMQDTMPEVASPDINKLLHFVAILRSYGINTAN